MTGAAGAEIEAGNTWVRPRTLAALRWVAAAAQVATILVATYAFDIALPLAACGMAVALLVLANLAILATRRDNRALSEAEAVLTLISDLAQLALVLSLTGGLNNPFALLIVGPVTVAASALGLRSTVILGVVTVILVTIVAFVHLPLRTTAGVILAVPQLFELGFWLSIVLGVVFLSAYSHRVATELRGVARALSATQMALAREQKLTDLSGVVAATAHELGTPLATIKLVSSELARAVAGRKDLAEVHDDIRLIGEQADRCRDILHSMGRIGKDDLHLRHAPLGQVLREAAEPHAARGRRIEFALAPEGGGAPRQPVIARRPEIIHGLRNLIQNAVDHARSDVRIEGSWSATGLLVVVRDDGPGYPQNLLPRLGEPFLRGSGGSTDTDGARPPERGGMGLGLFIAKTLLERAGAELDFANESDPDQPPGAVVRVRWALADIGAPERGAIGDNVTNRI
jgi:two-component system sensor histidine kinase RegB